MADKSTMVLVSKEEADFLNPFYQIANALFAEILTEEEERAAFIAQVEEAGLDVARVKKLGRRIIKYKWFTYFMTNALQGGDWTFSDPLRPIAMFSYYTSEQGTPQEPIDLYPIEDHQDFYKAEQRNYRNDPDLTVKEWVYSLQDALGLTREHFYIDDTSAQTLLYIADAYQLTNELDITQTQLRTSLSLPISKVWRQQQDIARADKGRTINVNPRNKEACIVKASISTKDHKKLVMPGLYKVIQTAIGNIMEDNPHIRPIVITPAQICKQIRLQDTKGTVSKAEEEAIIEAMDTMMETSAIIDYSAQLQEHKKLNKQADYDYSEKNAHLGRETGALIIGKKIEPGEDTQFAVWNGEPIKCAYVIYEPPAFYRYSHVVGQIVQVEAGLITTAKANKLPPAKKPAIKGDLESTTMQYEILEQIKYMQTQARYSKYNKRIVVDDILQAVYEKPEALTAAQRRTALKNIVAYLDLLVSRGDQITGYTEIRGPKNKIIGYNIQLPTNPKRRTRYTAK